MYPIDARSKKRAVRPLQSMPALPQLVCQELMDEDANMPPRKL
jgi:hypothetical protein